MNVVLKSVFINDTDKEGKPYKDKNGNPFKLANIETEDGQRASMYLHHKYGVQAEAEIKAWAAGDEVNIVLEKNEQGYLNFKIPTKTDLLEERVAILEDKLEKLGTFVKQHFSK